MRTFQFSDAKSHKFWNIEVTGKSYTVTYGRVGSAGQTQTKEFAGPAQAEAAAEKLIKEKLAKGYHETTPRPVATGSVREALEAALRDNPDDRSAYAAYADLLMEQGNPQGEFIQVQLALEDEDRPAVERKKLQQREKALLKAHRSEWVGDWERLARQRGPDDGQVELPGPQPGAFERGILAQVSIDELTVACARALVRAPQARLVRRLYLGKFPLPDEDEYEPGPDVPEGVDDAGQYPLLRWPQLANLRVFQLGFGAEEDYDEYCSFNCWTDGDHAHDFVKQMPRLEELYLFAHRVNANKIFTLPLPHLRVLQLYHSRSYPLDRLAKNASLRNLTHLLCHPHGLEYDDNPYIQLAGLRALVHSPHLPSLTHLRLRLADFGDRGCSVIIGSGILNRLKVLDLRHGLITDEGARRLAACPELKHLELLDVSRNTLTPAGVAALHATGVPLQASRQHPPLAGEDVDTREELIGEYLCEGDIE